MKVLLGVTGSIAAKLTPKMVKAFQDDGNEVNVVLSEAAKYFVDSSSYDCPTWRDHDEFPIKYERVNDDGSMMIPHIYLKDWADVLVVAPLTANTLAKIAHGMADNLLTSTIRAWKVDNPIVVAPAMNTDMWNHPVTNRNLQEIMHTYNYDVAGKSMFGNDLGSMQKTYDRCHYCLLPRKRLFVLVPPVSKKLACGAAGIGAMADINDIVNITKRVVIGQ